MSRARLLRLVRSDTSRIFFAVPAGVGAGFFWMVAIGGVLDLGAADWDAESTRLLITAVAIAAALSAAVLALLPITRASGAAPIHPGVSDAPGCSAIPGELSQTKAHHHV